VEVGSALPEREEMMAMEEPPFNSDDGTRQGSIRGAALNADASAATPAWTWQPLRCRGKEALQVRIAE
jgi:hypothetical protein